MNAIVSAGRFQETITVVTDTMRVCCSTNKPKEILAALDFARSKLESDYALVKEQKRQFIPLRKSISVVLNTVAGLADGVESRDITPKILRKVASEVQSKSLPVLIDCVNEALLQVEAKVGLVEAKEAVGEVVDKPKRFHDWREALSAVTPVKRQAEAAEEDVEEDPEDYAERLRQERTQSRLDQRDHEKSLKVEGLKAKEENLPRKIDGGYAVIRFPVIPLFEKPLNFTTLFTSMGFSVHELGGYTVLDNQTLLAIDKKAAANARLDPHAYALKALEVVNSRTLKAKYSMVSEVPQTNPKNANIALYWIMLNSKLTHMISKTHPKSWHLLTFADYSDELNSFHKRQHETDAEVHKRMKQRELQAKEEKRAAEEQKKVQTALRVGNARRDNAQNEKRSNRIIVGR